MSVEVYTPAENPFASRFTRPGALPFLFSPGDSAEAIVARFTAKGRRGAIVGQHGSGKSTLLEALLPHFSLEIRLRLFSLHDGERRLPRGFAGGLDSNCLLIIDGYEQLGLLGRGEVRRAVRRSGAGLLVTSHRPIRGLSTLVETAVSVELAMALVEQLAPDAHAWPISAADVRRQFDVHAGNLREVFFGLYDLYELRRP
jgi:hypothetical protein